MTDGNWVTLKKHLERLLLEGKRGNHPDYVPFFELFGKDRIVQICKEILREEKENESKHPKKV